FASRSSAPALELRAVGAVDDRSAVLAVLPDSESPATIRLRLVLIVPVLRGRDLRPFVLTDFHRRSISERDSAGLWLLWGSHGRLLGGAGICTRLPSAEGSAAETSDSSQRVAPGSVLGSDEPRLDGAIDRLVSE